jgi:probable F420-dependent oxidoreductase
MQLGRLGVWYPIDLLDRAELARFLAHVESLGYDALWYPEGLGYESMSVASFMLAHSKKLKIGSSIANIYARDAYTARRALIGLNKLYECGFILGLGVSHIPLVETVRGHRYEKPVPAMRAYLDRLTHEQSDADGWPFAIAALGPRMLKLAAERTRGALPYNVTPEHTAMARSTLGPDKWLVVEQKVCLETNPETARALARQALAIYMPLPNYRNNWLRIGFTEGDLEGGGSDRLVDAMVLWGDATSIKEKLEAHFRAGANQVCIQPVHKPGDFAARDRTLRALAG